MWYSALWVAVLWVIGFVHTAQGFCNLSTQYEVNGLCCDQCPPGHFKYAWCTADSPTGCQRCPEGTFNSEYNVYPRCEYCTRCIPGFHQVTTENCTPTWNTRCGCKKDENFTKFSKDGTLFWCCPKCPAGRESLKECSYTDFVTTCTDCPPGTFSDRPGSRCRNCTRCEREQSPCTNASDAVCSGPDVSANGQAYAAIAALSGCIFLGIVVLMVLMVPRCRGASVQQKDALPSGSSSKEKYSTQGSLATLKRPGERHSMLNLNDITLNKSSCECAYSGNESETNGYQSFCQTHPRVYKGLNT